MEKPPKLFKEFSKPDEELIWFNDREKNTKGIEKSKQINFKILLNSSRGINQSKDENNCINKKELRHGK